MAELQAWIAIARIDTGPVFRRFHRGDVVGDTRLGDRAVAEMIKDRIYGLKDPELNYHRFSGHSLRRGFLTSAGKQRADLLKLIAQSRHTRVDTVLGYIDNPAPFENHAAENLLLDAGEEEAT